MKFSPEVDIIGEDCIRYVDGLGFHFHGYVEFLGLMFVADIVDEVG